ncbi:hypothetical protein QU487_05950 [Crenobacter sp. SG2305]|uniref:hypothetical protein n=1 Tax=Crenobacter oryzisoli TaxID=3056844 RepID=UPI0025AAF69C|nr:hypothetical protein [Crenobacter sp. SG2305]MDN0082294.1 hypothetical protein [Crenobacter sp. SG2305]
MIRLFNLLRRKRRIAVILLVLATLVFAVSSGLAQYVRGLGYPLLAGLLSLLQVLAVAVQLFALAALVKGS